MDGTGTRISARAAAEGVGELVEWRGTTGGGRRGTTSRGRWGGGMAVCHQWGTTTWWNHGVPSVREERRGGGMAGYHQWGTTRWSNDGVPPVRERRRGGGKAGYHLCAGEVLDGKLVEWYGVYSRFDMSMCWKTVYICTLWEQTMWWNGIYNKIK